MKLFVIASRFPYPLEKGDKLRLYEQVKVLSRYYSVTLSALTDRKVSEDNRQELLKFCTEVLVFKLPTHRFFPDFLFGLMKGFPLQVAYFFHRNTVRKVREAISHRMPDLVYCQLIRTAPYVHRRPRAYKAYIDFMDAFAMNTSSVPGKLSGLRRMEARRIKKYESGLFDLFDNFFIISDRDRKYYPGNFADRIHLLPNGVDSDYYKPLPGIRHTHDVVFCGNLGYGPNVRAVSFLYKLAQEGHADWTTVVAGTGLSASWKRKSTSSFTILGWVDDLRKVYQSGKIFVAPILDGSGMQNKVLEAMAQGLPCVVSPFVNEAIGARDGRELFVARSTEAYTCLIQELLADPGLRKSVGESARKFVRDRFSWEGNMAVLVEKIRLSSRS